MLLTFDVCVILECLYCLQRAGSVLLEAAEFALPLLFASYSVISLPVLLLWIWKAVLDPH